MLEVPKPSLTSRCARQHEAAIALWCRCRSRHQNGKARWLAACSYYSGDRSTAWLKIKCVKRQGFVVVGWRPPEYGVDNVRGLFVATYEDGRLVYRGGVGTGFTDKMRREVWGVLQLIRTEQARNRWHAPHRDARSSLG